MPSPISPTNWAVFAGVVFIWSTTPLAIVLSSEGIDPYLNLTLRMFISALLLVLWFAYKQRRLPFYKAAMPTHLSVGGIGIGLSMSLVYFAAQTLPSSWIALIFGLTPLFTALLEGLLFRSLRLTLVHWLGIILATAGLWTIFHDPDHQLKEHMMMGLIAMLASTFFHALSASLVKRLKHQLAPVDIVMGGLMLAIPITTFFWFINGSNLPEHLSPGVQTSILYLAVIGSLAGFLLYYQVLAVFSATMSSFITLLAPSLALVWGALLNEEPITFALLIGASLILLGLTIFIVKPADKPR
jgi:drug/metabolite transporter (DMT)-like permease